MSDDEDLDSFSVRVSDSFYTSTSGYFPKFSYEPEKTATDIIEVIYNERMRLYVLVDVRGITTWRPQAIEESVKRSLTYPKYVYRKFVSLVFARKFNVYFALNKDFCLEVLNRNFDEICSVDAEMRNTTFMVFDHVQEELITGGTTGLKIWKFGPSEKKVYGEIKPMSNYELRLKEDLTGRIDVSCVKIAKIDPNMHYLYCCTDTDIMSYTLQNGVKLLCEFRGAHRGTICGCVYSPATQFLVSAGADLEIKLWNFSHGYMGSLTGHSRQITSLCLHPEDSRLIITAAMDGSIRLWSLAVMECLYQVQVMSGGIKWMGFGDVGQIYVASHRQIVVYSLNYLPEFWSDQRAASLRLELSGADEKSTRLVSLAEDSSIRLFCRGNAELLSTVLTPPSVSPLSRVVDFAYSRKLGFSYILLDRKKMAVYLSRSNPASRVAEWNLAEVQNDIIKRTKRQRVTSHSLLNQTVEHRAVQQQLSAKENRIMDCTSVGVLESPVVMWTDQGECCPMVENFLLLGLEDGKILFMDPLEKSLQHLEFTAAKDPILEIRHDRVHNCLITMCRAKDAAYLSMWDLPSLELQHELFCPSDIAGFARLMDSMITGHSSGHVFVQNLVPAVDNGPNAPRAAPTVPPHLLKFRPKPDHNSSVMAVDSCPSRATYCSVSSDGVLKLWNCSQILLSEILLEEEITAACFLNSFGDIVLSMKNHLFIMSHKKLTPGFTDGDEIKSVSDIAESEIIEDPAVKYEGIVEDPDPINLDSYLCPFRAELSLDFLEQKMHEVEEEEEETETESSVTESLRSSECQALLSPLDSSLGGELSDMEAESLENWTKIPHGHQRKGEKYEYQMPEFGISPQPSPQPSEAPEEDRSETPTPSIVDEKAVSEGHVSSEEEKETPATQKESAPKPKQIKETPQKAAETVAPSRRGVAAQLSAVRIDANDIPGARPRGSREPLKMAQTAPALGAKEAQQPPPERRERPLPKFRNRATTDGGGRRRRKSKSGGAPAKSEPKKLLPRGDDGAAKDKGKAPTLTKGDIGEAGNLRSGAARSRKSFTMDKLDETFSDSLEEESEEESEEEHVETQKSDERTGEAKDQPAAPRPVSIKRPPVRRGRAPFSSSSDVKTGSVSQPKAEEEAEGEEEKSSDFPPVFDVEPTEPPRPRIFNVPEPPPRPPSSRRSSAEFSPATMSLDDFLRISQRPAAHPAALPALGPEELQLAFEKYADSLSDHPYYKFQSLQHPESKDGARASGWLKAPEGTPVTPGFDLAQSINRLHRGSRSGRYRPSSAFEFDRRAASASDRATSALLRPHTTAHISALEEWATEGEYFQKLQDVYNNLLLRYQSARPETPANKIFHNDGIQTSAPDLQIERHMLLRLRRQLRHQSAADRRHSTNVEKEERRRAMLGHRFCAHEPSEEEEATARLSSAPRALLLRSAREGADRRRHPHTARLASAPPPQVGDQRPKAQAPSTPYRISLNNVPTWKDEKLYDLKSKDDVKASLHLKYSAPSIPSKCCRYTLVSYPEEEHDISPPTIMEERLIRNRFPQFKDSWVGDYALLEPKPWMHLLKNSNSPRS